MRVKTGHKLSVLCRYVRVRARFLRGGHGLMAQSVSSPSVNHGFVGGFSDPYYVQHTHTRFLDECYFL
jgi:hypothetical protein